MKRKNASIKGWIVVAGVFIATLAAHAQGTWLESVIAAHGAKTLPDSVQMTGKVDRNGKQESFRLLATKDEQLRIAYGDSGTDTLVMGSKMGFHDDGKKIQFDATPPGFAQLDITGLFFVQQLRNRAVRVVTTGEWSTMAGVKSQRVRVENPDRSAMRKGMDRISDVVDLYVSDSGLLSGVSRSFYEGRPEAYTQSFTFSDYRKTGGVLLPYRIDVYIKFQLRSTFKVDRYQFDVPYEKSQFFGVKGQ